MTSKEIYKLWLSNTEDHRYLRPKRWDVLKQAIFDHKVETVLEFGSGVSTILLASLGLKITSYETDPDYMAFVALLCPSQSNVTFHYWNNLTVPLLDNHYDLAIVDGTLPRIAQLALSTRRTNLLALDDYAGRTKNIYADHLTNFKRANKYPPDSFMAIFERKD